MIWNLSREKIDSPSSFPSRSQYLRISVLPTKFRFQIFKQQENSVKSSEKVKHSNNNKQTKRSFFELNLASIFSFDYLLPISEHHSSTCVTSNQWVIVKDGENEENRTSRQEAQQKQRRHRRGRVANRIVTSEVHRRNGFHVNLQNSRVRSLSHQDMWYVHVDGKYKHKESTSFRISRVFSLLQWQKKSKGPKRERK